MVWTAALPALPVALSMPPRLSWLSGRPTAAELQLPEPSAGECAPPLLYSPIHLLSSLVTDRLLLGAQDAEGELCPGLAGGGKGARATRLARRVRTFTRTHSFARA